MSEPVRKKSPRAPSMPLDEALDKAFRAYERERLHPASADVIAQHIGYKNANNGAALSALASLRYFGLLERSKEGRLSVAKNVESYKFAPDENSKHSLLLAFLKSPPLYAELLESYKENLPSDGNLRYALIQRGFSPVAAENALAAFLKSVQYADFYGERNQRAQEQQLAGPSENIPWEKSSQPSQQHILSQSRPNEPEVESDEFDKIPVRLSGGRRAWLFIPEPFFQADRQRLKAQIDLILALDDNE